MIVFWNLLEHCFYAVPEFSDALTRSQADAAGMHEAEIKGIVLGLLALLGVCQRVVAEAHAEAPAARQLDGLEAQEVPPAVSSPVTDFSRDVLDPGNMAFYTARTPNVSEHCNCSLNTVFAHVRCPTARMARKQSQSRCVSGKAEKSI